MMEYKTPWWYKYRKRKYNPRNYHSLEMLIRKSFVETFKEYMASTSMAGVKQIADTNNSILLRLFWVGIFCACLSAVIYFLQYTWVATLTKPLVVTGESFTYPIKDIAFPAVALCNINRISRKALKTAVAEAHQNEALSHMTLTLLESFFIDMGRLIDFNYDETRPHVKSLESYNLQEAGNQTVEIMKRLAPSCKEMLIKCMWAGKVVNCSSIFQVRRTALGHCCAFNYVLDYESADKPHRTIAAVKSQTVPGVANGLLVIIDAMTNDYAYPLAHRTGFEVMLFDPTHFADVTGGRVIQRTVQPNQAKYFQITSIKQIASDEVRKYPLKTRKCLFRDENHKVFKNMYSYSACIIRCRIQSVQSLCKCTPYFLPATIRGKTCSLNNLRCLNKYKEKLQYLYPINTKTSEGLEQELADSLFCPDCLPDCELTQHFIKSYKIMLPKGSKKSKGFQNEFLNGVNLTDKCVISIYQPITGAILHRLDVIAYWFEILSNIGGFAGMLMGIGIYTIVEIIYFLLIRFLRAIYINCS